MHKNALVLDNKILQTKKSSFNNDNNNITLLFKFNNGGLAILTNKSSFTEFFLICKVYYA